MPLYYTLKIQKYKKTIFYNFTSIYVYMYILKYKFY